MAIQKRACDNHPDRMAIGVCVVTGRPMCAECSTRYEGVNYSKEGLRQLQEQRAHTLKKAGAGEKLLGGVLLLVSPALLFLLYLAYRLAFRALIGMTTTGI